MRSISRFLDEIPDGLYVPFGGTKTENVFRRGEHIYHPEYGEGVVTNSWTNEGEDFVLVRFSNGRCAQFMPHYTKLKKI